MKRNSLKTIYTIFLFTIVCLLITVNTASAEDGNGKGISIKAKTTEQLSLTAAVPFFKFRQGEEFRIFDGAAGGLRWLPFYKSNNGILQNLHLSGLLMISTFDGIDKNAVDPTATKQTQVFSAGIVLGYSWLQFGYGYDFVSSEEKDSFEDREKGFFMLNLSGVLTF